MVLLNIVKEDALNHRLTQTQATLGDVYDDRLDPDSSWVELIAKATKGTLTGGTSPAWKATAMDELVKRFSMHIGGSFTPISRTSVVNLKRLAMLEHGEEVLPDGYWDIAFGGAFPAWAFKNGLRLVHEFDSLSNLTTGNPTSQAGTKVEFFLQKVPRQAKQVSFVAPPIIKTVEKDLKDVDGEQLVVNLNSGHSLRYMMVIPSSATLINKVKLSLSDGEDVLREHPWDLLRVRNKREFYLDALEPAGGFAAYRLPYLPTGRERIGKLELHADINSEADGKVTVVTMEKMNPGLEKQLIGQLQE